MKTLEIDLSDFPPCTHRDPRKYFAELREKRPDLWADFVRRCFPELSNKKEKDDDLP